MMKLEVLQTVVSKIAYGIRMSISMKSASSTHLNHLLHELPLPLQDEIKESIGSGEMFTSNKPVFSNCVCLMLELSVSKAFSRVAVPGANWRGGDSARRHLSRLARHMNAGFPPWLLRHWPGGGS